MRATLGFWGARLLSSPYRVIAATYWFAAQAIAGALRDPGGRGRRWAAASRRSSRSRSASALFHATLAVLGFDVMRWLLRVVLPISLAFVARDGRAVPRHRRPALRRRPRLRLARPAPDLGRLRRRRHADGRLEPDARDERRRLLPLHADAPRRADRPGRLGARRRARRHVHRRLRGGGDRRDEPVRRRRRPDEQQGAARRCCSSRSSSRASPRTSATSTRPACRS